MGEGAGSGERTVPMRAPSPALVHRVLACLAGMDVVCRWRKSARPYTLSLTRVGHLRKLLQQRTLSSMSRVALQLEAEARLPVIVPELREQLMPDGPHVPAPAVSPIHTRTPPVDESGGPPTEVADDDLGGLPISWG